MKAKKATAAMTDNERERKVPATAPLLFQNLNRWLKMLALHLNQFSFTHRDLDEVEVGVALLEELAGDMPVDVGV